LLTVLRNVQSVEIITAKGAMPNPSWVNFVVTAKARAAIRHFLKGLRRQEAIELGARLIDQALAEFKLSLDEINGDVLAGAVGELGMKDRDELFEKVGLGERLAPLVARRLLPAANGEESFSSARQPLAIAGTEGLLVTYARCCFPIPDDSIFAYLSTGRGVVVHRESCANVEDYRKHPENWLSVAWEPAPDRLFHCEIRVDVANRMGVLAAVAAAISGSDTNIERVAVEERDTETSALVFELRVRHRKHLAQIVRVIRRMPDTLRVSRTIASHGRADD
jgi:(p)ppGpp synthase/HD superfamily hydrolase